MPFTDIPFTETARRALDVRWGLRFSGDPVRLRGGEESAAFAVDDHVVRVGPEWRSTEEAEWCYAIASHASTEVPEVAAPVATTEGRAAVRVDGRPMSVWPLVPGRWPTRETPGVLAQAASLLARLHRALAGMQPPPRPVPSGLEPGLDGSEPSAEPALADPELDSWLAEFHRTHRNHQAVHGDFYPGNTLTDGGVLTAVVDWDEACVVPPAVEVAYAALEWAEQESAIDIAAMHSFLQAYAAAGGPAGLLDEETLAQLIRHRLRREAVYFHEQRRLGVVHDMEDFAYHARRLEVFSELRP
ncbi:Ser/Thr protein kinase RdoA involved in Cpx stress response, MazF antagonist [Saccharopolyspora shandongensis]|uniref:Ser/Thr protein kinase RdoA involved in Cpx stress response, MazF antagonist n=1 Tax=Saccharopolyspora shandongensis TaxID=418495 RepID=A0A1H3QE36_9PSEU|nr:phosphotransferase [Saccharopolyspora shandongensis]SDZ11275.1 Ser/Thr protein kinase RdoA involved in Cpx stress response, MazF antagonist [Saccharopolyspora shandongensis]